MWVNICKVYGFYIPARPAFFRVSRNFFVVMSVGRQASSGFFGFFTPPFFWRKQPNLLLVFSTFSKKKCTFKKLSAGLEIKKVKIAISYPYSSLR